jgi:hypothetical protein
MQITPEIYLAKNALNETMSNLNTSRLQMTTGEIENDIKIAMKLVETKKSEIEALLAAVENLKAVTK